MPERAARLTAPGSALVADLSQKIVAPRDACFALDASRRKAVYDAEDTASLLSFGQHNLCWIVCEGCSVFDAWWLEPGPGRPAPIERAVNVRQE